MSLTLVKIIHTVIWAFFAACVVGIPVAASCNRFALAAWLSLIVVVEVAILLLNRWSCPLTAVAARYTDERSANFDIYLPDWLARHNKTVFGTLYVLGVLYASIRWLMVS